QEILSRIEALNAAGEPMALATIVSTTGSTYRHPGARMLIPADGPWLGNVSGGCLEDDVARIGREVMRSGEPRVTTFDLSADEDAVWGYGLGCNGSFEIFIEPTAGAVRSAELLRANPAGCLVTVLTGPDAGSHRFEADASHAARPSIREEDGARVFHEPIQPPMRLIVCGAGHDAIALVQQAADLGWRVTVADVRRALLTLDRFPGAADFCDADPERAAEALRSDPRAAVMLMSHNYLRDVAYLRSLLDADWAYLGVMGPRGRTEQMLGEIGRPEKIARLHAPAGLDIGAETPDEVARAIVAEILAVTRGHPGGPLRDRRAPIHDSRAGNLRPRE
ncbi:MAG TPA: XdhC family protein, partial [Candidatus Limnocylindria bacterium]